jgi:predicted GNAT family acetyltransferase
VRRLIAEQEIYIWDDSSPAAMAATNRKLSDCNFNEPVYTLPYLRSKGYGTACVAA